MRADTIVPEADFVQQENNVVHEEQKLGEDTEAQAKKYVKDAENVEERTEQAKNKEEAAEQEEAEDEKMALVEQRLAAGAQAGVKRIASEARHEEAKKNELDTQLENCEEAARHVIKQLDTQIDQLNEHAKQIEEEVGEGNAETAKKDIKKVISEKEEAKKSAE